MFLNNGVEHGLIKTVLISLQPSGSVLGTGKGDRQCGHAQTMCKHYAILYKGLEHLLIVAFWGWGSPASHREYLVTVCKSLNTVPEAVGLGKAWFCLYLQKHSHWCKCLYPVPLQLILDAMQPFSRSLWAPITKLCDPRIP